MKFASSTSEGIGRHHSTVVNTRRAELRPLPLLIRAHAARVQPNPLRLEEGACVLGAGSDVDQVIEAETVSRRHAEIRLIPEGVSITDLGSKNGLFYLGQRFQNMILQPGSRFQLGSVDVDLQLDHASIARWETGASDSYGDLIGVSAPMRELFNQLVRLEGSKINLLVQGESGTGKELIARAIHEHSPVRRGPLVVVNCGALDRNLARSELFGHQRGAFTGAVQRQMGAFEAAEGGTLFLDEIGELPLDVQPVLLRALEARVITPVGSHQERPVDVRLIAATHRDLHAAVAAGTFREDLLYRICVVTVTVAPLRERLDDVPVIAESLARRRGARLPDDFLAALSQHTWPGNVRELCNAVDAYLAIGALPRPRGDARGTGIDATLKAFVDPTKSYADQKQEIVDRFTRAYLERLLETTSGNQSEAARLSGLERSYLGKLIARLGLKRD
jgi:two-component system nitrogen regulation response regulator GlnG